MRLRTRFVAEVPDSINAITHRGTLAMTQTGPPQNCRVSNENSIAGADHS